MDAIQEQISGLESRLKEAGVPLDLVLRDAEVNRSSWTRWKQGLFAPNMKRWQGILDASDKRIAERTSESA